MVESVFVLTFVITLDIIDCFMATNKKYYMGLKPSTNEHILCSSKTLLADFYGVGVKTITRWIKKGRCKRDYKIIVTSMTIIKHKR